MHKMIKELRRRRVFRTVGLYIGGIWIVLQAANILLPIYDAPEWTLKSLIILFIIGLPIAVTLAWFYDITDGGIQLDGEITETTTTNTMSKGRKVDFVIIGMLLICLSGSLFLNFKPQEPLLSEALKPAQISMR